MSTFDYYTAFDRTIGWVTSEELARLRGARVAIAGLGGVGGVHLITLARLGVGGFHIADLDRFELHNMNRQAGAAMRHLGRPKTEVMQALAEDVNPELELRAFADGVHAENLDQFLENVDIYVDGLDFFEFDIRRTVFEACARRGIPAVTVAPLGMGAALLNFHPEGMSFSEYFDLVDGLPEEELAVRFMLGLAPALLHMGYLAEPRGVDFQARRGPSTPMACELCAGILGTEVLKILLGRGRVHWAPRGMHFDTYRQRLRHTWRPGGNRRNPLQRLLLSVARRRLAAMRAEAAGRPTATGAAG